MWESFFDQRKEHGRRNTSDDESEEEEPQPVASGIEAVEMMTEGELIYIMNRKAQK